jgi:hypothetical protein
MLNATMPTGLICQSQFTSASLTEEFSMKKKKGIYQTATFQLLDYQRA